MKHYILVHWKNRLGENETRRTLVNLHKIVTVVDSVQGCKIHFQGYCLEVWDSFEDICGMIEAAEAEGSRKPADRPLMGTAARERQGEAAPQRRHGKWEAGKDGWPFCPFCGVPADIDREEFRLNGDVRAAETPFCPTCGARLEGTQEGRTNESSKIH